MSALQKTKTKKVAEVHSCAECKLKEWDMKFENLDLEKKPTLLTCKFQPFMKRSDGTTQRVRVVRTNKACEHLVL